MKPTRPSFGFFMRRSFAGLGPKFALVEALLVGLGFIVLAGVWRAAAGSTGRFEQLVPLLGSLLRLSLAVPLAFLFMRAIELDESEHLLSLARRIGVSRRDYLLRRGLAAALIIAILVAGPMVVLSLVEATFGGGLEGALARASMGLVATVDGAVTGLVFGFGAVILGVHVRSRLLVFGSFVGLSLLSNLLELGGSTGGRTVRQVVSPLLALEDFQALLFAAPGSTSAGISAIVALGIVLFVVAMSGLGLFSTQRLEER